MGYEGITTDDLPRAVLADDLLVHRDGSTRRIAVDDFAGQIVEVLGDAMADDILDRGAIVPVRAAFGVVSGAQRAMNLAALVAAAEAHAVSGGTLVARGRLEIAGSTNVTIRGSVDFSGLTLGVAGYTGMISFANDYADSSAFAVLDSRHER